MSASTSPQILPHRRHRQFLVVPCTPQEPETTVAKCDSHGRSQAHCWRIAVGGRRARATPPLLHENCHLWHCACGFGLCLVVANSHRHPPRRMPCGWMTVCVCSHLSSTTPSHRRPESQGDTAASSRKLSLVALRVWLWVVLGCCKLTPPST